MGAISFELVDFSTDPQRDNGYSFFARTAQGEELAVQGALTLNPLSSQGSVKIGKLQLKDFDVFLADYVGFGIEAGSASVAFDYRFNPVSEPRRMHVENGALSLEGLVLQGNGESAPFQRIGRLEAKGFSLDLMEGNVRFESVRLDEAYLKVARDKEGLLNVIRYLSPKSRQQEIAAAVRAERLAERQKARARQIRLGIVSAKQDIGVAFTSAWRQLQEAVDFSWKLDVGTLDVAQNTLELRDDFLAKPVDFTFTDITLHASGLRNHGGESFPWTFSVGTHPGGSARAEGSLVPEPTSAAFKYAVLGFDVAPFAPYLASFTRAQLVSLKLSSEGEGNVLFPANALPKLALNFSARADDLRVDAPGFDKPVLMVDAIALDEAHLASNPLSCRADLLLVTHPALNLTRDKAGKINLVELFPALAAKLGKPAGVDKPGSKPAPAASAVQPALETASAQGTAVPAIALENFRLGELRIERGALTLRDDSVRPASVFAVKDAAFTFGPVELKPGVVSRFSAKAALNGGAHGVVTVEGELMPLDPLKSAKFAFTSSVVTLAPFGGYAEPLVGRAMQAGTVDASLKYKINGGLMKGDNAIKLSQLAFRERQSDSTGPNLPLDLGMAILVDRNGVMKLDLPVSGDLNDPDFELKQIVIYAITNVFQKLATAPFAALGSLFGADAVKPATEVAFEPGSAEILPEQLPGLNQLGNALNERPQLALVLRPVEDAPADVLALREGALQTRIDAFAKEKGISADRATERLFNQLLDEMEAMEPSRRAQVEGAIAAAHAQGAAPKEESLPPTVVAPTTSATPPPSAVAAVKPNVVSAAPARGAGTLRVRRRAAHAKSAVHAAPVAVKPAKKADATKLSETAAVVAPAPEAPAISPRRLPVAQKRAVLLSQTEVSPSDIRQLAAERSAAVSAALTSPGAPHPLPAVRVRLGEAWQPQGGAASKPPTPTVHLELSVAK